jgi:hypothetical protein
MILVIIKEKKLYIVPRSFDAERFIKRDAGSIYYSCSMITYINKSRKDLIYNFPELTEEQEKIIENTEPFDYINELYHSHIKS